jgi:putative Mg2+ transporter-C (MgtC) family protein
VRPQRFTVWCRARRFDGAGIMLGRCFSGDRSDRHIALPQLRVQLHRYLPHVRAERGSRANSLRPLPLDPLVISNRVSSYRSMLAPAPRVELILLARLIVAGALAAVLGWEREAAHKSAGLRTHMLVGIASALFTVLAELAVSDYPGGAMRSDPVRVIQAVAIGIGFLGSGVIFVAKSGEHVLGLTTAASIWATAAVGITTGLGHYILAGGATVVLLLVLRFMARFEKDDRG